MNFDWTPTQTELFRTITGFARARLENEAASQRDKDAEFSRRAWDECGKFGLMGLSVAAEYGGMGLDTLTTAGAVEAFGLGCDDMGLVFSACAHLFACTMPIQAFGEERVRGRMLPRLARGEWIGANAITEQEAGSDAFALRTTARLDGDFYVLDGIKTYVTNAPVADVFVVYASTNLDYGVLGVSAFAVERGSSGLSVGEPFSKVGLATSPIASVYLDGCRVPRHHLLGAEGIGARVFASSMQWERACLFASYLGAMDRQLATVIDFAQRRKQSGKRIGQFQAISHKIVDMKLRLDAARLLLYRACWTCDQGADGALDVALAKIAVTEAAVQSGLDAIQIHGSVGIDRDAGIERALRDALPARLFSGTSEIQRNVAAKKLGL